MIKKLLLTLLLFLACVVPIHATSIPTQDDSIYVNDYASVLSSSTKSTLVDLNQQSDYKYGGYVVVATFDFVEGDLYDYSYRLFNQWGIGDSNNNNGVLLVLDIGNDNYCYILGTGIERILDDYDAREIIDTYMEPYFAIKDYDNAVMNTTKQFLNVIENGNFVVEDSILNNNEEEYVNFNSITDIFGVLLFGIMSIGTSTFVLIILFIILTKALGSRRTYNRPYTTYNPRPMRPRTILRRPMSSRHHRPMGGGHMSRPSGMSRPSRPSSGRVGGSHHSGGRSRGAGGTRH